MAECFFLSFLNLLGFIVFRKENTNSYLPLTKLIKNTLYLDIEIEASLTYLYQTKAYYKGGTINYSNEAG